MGKFIARIIINAVAIAATVYILQPHIAVMGNDIGTYLLLGLIFGIINALIKPLVSLLTCPLVILTLGLFVLVINGFMLLLTASFSGGRLVVDGLGWAIIGGIIMGLVNVVLESLFGLNRTERG